VPENKNDHGRQITKIQTEESESKAGQVRCDCQREKTRDRQQKRQRGRFEEKEVGRPMKKTFPLRHPKKQSERLVEAARAEVNKYLRRERRKTLPEGVDYWDFDCKVGVDSETARPVHVAEVSSAIGQVLSDGAESCYVEILAKPAQRTKAT